MWGWPRIPAWMCCGRECAHDLDPCSAREVADVKVQEEEPVREGSPPCADQGARGFHEGGCRGVPPLLPFVGTPHHPRTPPLYAVAELAFHIRVVHPPKKILTKNATCERSN